LAKFFIFFLKAVKRRSQPSTSGLTIFCPNPVTTDSPGSYDDGDDDDGDDSNNDDPLTKQSFEFTVLFHCLL
jgi:hypothetical protein